MRIYKRILYLIFFLPMIWSGKPSDCLDGARESPIGEVLDMSNQTFPSSSGEQVDPAPLPSPNIRRNLRGGYQLFWKQKDNETSFQFLVLNE